MSKIMVLTAVHGMGGHRKQVCEFFARRMEAVREATGIETMMVGSEGELSRRLAENYGHHYIEFPNKPLSRKFNAGLEACREHNPTHVMILGSDDIVSTSLFESYIDLLNNHDYDLLGITDLYFLGLNDKRWGFGVCGYWDAGRRFLGVGRCYSSRILNYCDWNLWYDNRNASLDAAATVTVSNYAKQVMPPLSVSIKVRRHNHLVIDIKTRGNISSMSSFKLENVDYHDLFKSYLPYNEYVDIINYCDTKIGYNGHK